MSSGLAAGRQKKMIIMLVLIVLVLTVYWQIQNFNFIYYDDYNYVLQNYQIRSDLTYRTIVYVFTDAHTGNWHPLTMISHMLDWQLYGENAGGHHWNSLIIHIINTVLLFLLLNSLTGALWRSALVAALFAIHPINVESVAWVAERKNVLSTFFWILTMLFYVRYVQKPGWKRYLPVFICFALGLMSKPMLVTLPFVLLLLDYWPLNRTAINTRNDHPMEGDLSLKPGRVKLRFLIWEKIPLFILTAISICVTLYTQHTVGAVINTDYLPLTKRISNAIFSYGLYIRKMFWPFDLSVFYPQYNIEIGDLLIASSFLVMLSAMVLRYYRKYPYFLVGWFWYLGTLVPVIGIIQVGSQAMADRYAYVPFIGLFIMLVWYAADVAKRKKTIKYIFVCASLLLVVALSVACWQRCQLWGDSFSLWNDVLKKHQVAFIYNFRGLAYADQGQYRLALADYNAALSLDQKFVEALNDRANLYISIGQHAKAINDYNEAQRLKPKFVNTYYNRGTLYLLTGQLDKAIKDFTEVINIEPDMANAFNKRGLAFRLKGQYEKSFADINQALRINRNLADAYYNRGILQNIKKQYTYAVTDFTEALSIKPQYADAYFHRGLSFAFLGKYDNAIADYRQVLNINPHYIPALNNLGALLRKMNRYEESSAQYQKLLQIKPDDQNALRALIEIEGLKMK